MVFLDSSIIIDFLRNKQETLNKIRKLYESNAELSTSSINVFELLKGALRSSKETPEKVYSFLSNIKILNFDSESAKKSAEIFEELRKRGELIDIADLMIASVVIMNNETLLTDNRKHFERISEIRFENRD